MPGWRGKLHPNHLIIFSNVLILCHTKRKCSKTTNFLSLPLPPLPPALPKFLHIIFCATLRAILLMSLTVRLRAYPLYDMYTPVRLMFSNFSWYFLAIFSSFLAKYFFMLSLPTLSSEGCLQLQINLVTLTVEEISKLIKVSPQF